MEVKQIDSMAQIDAADWNQLCGLDYPFLRHEFLSALEQSAAVCPQTGWEATHLLVIDNQKLQAALPLYSKTHSWGEYVFDQQWAQAYQQHGLAYYPKLVSAIPFTPCQGQRLLFAPEADQTAVCALLFGFIQQLAELRGVSSWHCLFPEHSQLEQLKSLGLSVREGVQFQWFNRNYATFSDFLQTLSADKRKMIKRERRRVAEQGIQMQRIAGPDVSDAQWQVFFRFYALTYLKRSSEPYLNPAFFKQIAQTMPEQLMLVLAIKDDTYVGAALSFIGANTLYGRYWGCQAEYNALHFEACYYQGLDYCIEHGLARFDSGAQGEHKISRGFEPVTTYSAHWLKDAGFAKAVAQFVDREKQAIQHYKQDAASYLPFKRLP
ncbi:GNAT family N-acetyltransferase [Methylomonas sp. MO1]|uniref:GNAT family N-acetyltransferase n=1 Tax=Methylomonas sp. MO1 TaxID=3073619 RepID=UPI0028A38954|nr:GNAT family N-acetyltransferase [Methylomonas sp. MO1]MDT4291547.1 GNAT family N-acetyltransferase [Methylomonas sp. MO1]